MNGSQRRVRTGIVALSDIATWVGIEEGSGALVAGNLCRCGFTGRELEKIARVGFEIQVTVKPPFVESVIGERSDRSIVVRESIGRNIEPIHARMEER